MNDLVKRLRQEAGRNALMQSDKEHHTNRRRNTFRGRNMLFTQAADRIEELESRLEWREDGHDGIYCRDETIRIQDKRIEELEATIERVRDEVRQFNDVTEYCTSFKIDCEPEVMQHWRNRFKAAIKEVSDEQNKGQA